ncbi:unnamed protein product, partial [Trichogramma brassicae]
IQAARIARRGNAPGGTEHTLVNDQYDETATRDQLSIVLRSARHTLVNDLHGATSRERSPRHRAEKRRTLSLASDLQCVGLEKTTTQSPIRQMMIRQRKHPPMQTSRPSLRARKKLMKHCCLQWGQD